MPQLSETDTAVMWHRCFPASATVEISPPRYLYPTGVASFTQHSRAVRTQYWYSILRTSTQPAAKQASLLWYKKTDTIRPLVDSHGLQPCRHGLQPRPDKKPREHRFVTVSPFRHLGFGQPGNPVAVSVQSWNPSPARLSYPPTPVRDRCERAACHPTKVLHAGLSTFRLDVLAESSGETGVDDTVRVGSWYRAGGSRCRRLNVGRTLLFCG